MVRENIYTIEVTSGKSQGVLIATGQGDDYSTGCLLDYPYF